MKAGTAQEESINCEETMKARGGGVSEIGRHGGGSVDPGAKEVADKVEVEDASVSSSSISSSQHSAEGFEGYARVFFQGRNDRVAQQLLPTNSSTFARDNYLYIKIEPDASLLQIYPDREEKKLLVDPAVELKYFYAARVPGSNAGAALFRKEDDRTFQRYIFRFEFRNDRVVQPAALMYSLVRSSKACKNLQRMNWMGPLDKTPFKRQEDHDEDIREAEKKCQEMHSAYMGAVGDLIRDGLVAADSFVGLVNSVLTEEGPWSRRIHGTSWGAGYEDVEGEHDSSDSSDWSTDNEDEYEDDDDDDILTVGKTGEKIEESFERLFGQVKKKVKDA